MKYASPTYERAELETSDIIMSCEPSYTVNESSDQNGNKIGDVVVNANSIFAQYFN